MNVIVAVAIAVSSFVVMMFQLVKNKQNRELMTLKSKLLPFCLLSLTLMVVSDMMLTSPQAPASNLFFDVVMGTCQLTLMSSVLWNGKSVIRMVAMYWIVDLGIILYRFLHYLELVPAICPDIYILMSEICWWIFVSQMICCIWRFLNNTRAVLRSGGIWQMVCLCVDIVYVLISGVALMVTAAFPDDLTVYVTAAFLWILSMAVSFRVYSDSQMILCYRMERRILESLKISIVEMPTDMSRSESVYQEIYDRIVSYFETEKPYLRSDLAIDDLVKVVFSNKLYISRAISQITGRNFCQFVNYYRVMHSVELFRKNPELKATELAVASGFNSLVTYSMSFRLYMKENPSDWIRKERNRRSKAGANIVI